MSKLLVYLKRLDPFKVLAYQISQYMKSHRNGKPIQMEAEIDGDFKSRSLHFSHKHGSFYANRSEKLGKSVKVRIDEEVVKLTYEPKENEIKYELVES